MAYIRALSVVLVIGSGAANGQTFTTSNPPVPAVAPSSDTANPKTAAAPASAVVAATPTVVAPVVATAIPTPVIAAVAVSAPAGEIVTLPANTELLLRLSEEVNSKRIKEGHEFRVALAQDVMIGNFIVLPKGTPGKGYVSYRTGKGAFGKSAKMEITMKSLDLPNGRSIPLQGLTRQEGQGNTGATVGTAVAAGPFAAFVTGRSAIFQEGREVRGFTRESIQVALPK